VLRELVHMVGRGDVTPETCDTVVKYGYASRLPAMGPFEHADLAGLELMGDQAREVWPDLATADAPDDGPIGELRERGWTGMAAGRGFYDWTIRDPDAFRLERDREIVRRLKITRGGEVVLTRPDA
jgi:3-hydroxybutyryl-CoA dehydrogenase